MSLGLHNLQVSRGSVRKVKRVGRGNASGQGTYAGRGSKGQRARTGGKRGLAAHGLRSYLLKIPKVRGFKSQATKPAVIKLEELAKLFKEGELVTRKKLVKVGLLHKRVGFYKVLAGPVSKKLIIQAHAFSAQARSAIVKAGGKAERIKELRAKSN